MWYPRPNWKYCNLFIIIITSYINIIILVLLPISDLIIYPNIYRINEMITCIISIISKSYQFYYMYYQFTFPWNDYNNFSNLQKFRSSYKVSRCYSIFTIIMLFICVLSSSTWAMIDYFQNPSEKEALILYRYGNYNDYIISIYLNIL